MLFRDRADAGRQLAQALGRYRGRDAVVLALPRGGVPVAAVVAERLSAPLDLLLVRKIGVPAQPELAMGAVIDGAEPVIVRNDDVIALAGVSEDAFQQLCRQALAEIERRRERYLGGRAPVALAGRLAIVVDDGIATGATVRAAIGGLRQRGPGEIVIATPVAPPEAVAVLRREADAVVCLHQPSGFGAISLYYGDFRQVEDEEVVALLKTARGTERKSGA